jgi:UDP-2,3-diacylglucosamine pyrophosphatase LpxH
MLDCQIFIWMKYKSIFISDIHLGIKYSRTDLLIKFLKENECDSLYLVGDIIDGWELKRRWFWSNEYNLLIQKLLRKARHGTNIIYLTGNHDAFLRKFDELIFGNIKITDSVIHESQNGKKYIVTHGDKFDGVLVSDGLLSRIGSWLYDIVLWADDKYNKCRTKFGYKKHSLALAVKTAVKEAVKYINDFEEKVIQHAKKEQVTGIITGHIHHACSKVVNDVEYWNCGSWIEGKGHAIVEHMDGTLELIHIE